ncbi:MAG: type II toxin-antitoxin system RelE/ParE family toxin [Methylovulum sp.]|uniref:type II toxin-antitoxin system RelE family toxin n=1 Tax=Methylovulum sp. TaxID=1916980 RepID=UPI0026089AAE|nr:type II toxin-antitoxin system RelE/ParE family toxin [Methylovulum sp.]MDD2722759.1 type II toxin-antitoxin system RelE/ParE family toxin [Methylovulum sp.]MDD5124577.1 type II toxin-antitoxin system RelE/ParE family toxin [Methylovulum sp.]
MKVKFEARFAKDLRAIQDPKILNRMKKIIEDCKLADNLSSIKHMKKMQGYERFYRIRLADYRIGIVDDTIIFARILPRKDIYKYFP